MHGLTLTYIVVFFALVLSTAGISEADAQTNSFNAQFGAIKFLDAYFGSPNEKIEVDPGDSNVPLTVVITNVGTEDVVGIRGQLSMPLAISGPDGSRSALADADSNAFVGQIVYLTFFVDVSAQSTIGDYNATVSVDYSRLRESGTRNEVFDFEFSITGNTVINVAARDTFLMSLHENTIVIDIINTGTAPVSKVAVSMQDINGQSSQSMTNMENIVVTKSSWDLGDIIAGSSKQLVANAYVPGTLSDEVLRIPLLISYLDAHGNAQSVTRMADFYVRGFIDTRIYDINVIELAGKLAITGKVINEGNEDALFGFATIVPLEGSNITQTTQFIDEIETDSPVSFSIPLSFNGEPRYGEHDIRVDIRYKDSTRDEIVVSHESTVYLPEPVIDEANNSFLLMFLILPLVIGLVVFARKRSRRKSRVQ